MTEMSPAEQIFFAALEMVTPAEREAYLDSACAGQPELRARVDRLLAAHPRIGGFLESDPPTEAHGSGDPDTGITGDATIRLTQAATTPNEITSEEYRPDRWRRRTTPIPMPPRQRRRRPRRPARPGSRRAKGSARSSPAGTRWSR